MKEMIVDTNLNGLDLDRSFKSEDDMTSQHLSWFILVLLVDIVLKVNLETLHSTHGGSDRGSAWQGMVSDLWKGFVAREGTSNLEKQRVYSSYNVVNFPQNSHNRHPIACPQGRGMGCLLWI